MYYYGYRYYSPELGRWVNRDPIGENGGKNLYGFVGNDSISKWDGFGLEVYSGPDNCGKCKVVYVEGELSGDGAKTSPPTFKSNKMNFKQCAVCHKFNIDKSMSCTIKVTFDPDTDPDKIAPGIGISYFQHEWKHVKCGADSFSFIQSNFDKMKNKCCKADFSIFDTIQKVAALKRKACNNYVDCDDYKKSTNPKIKAKAAIFCKHAAQAQKQYLSELSKLNAKMTQWPTKCQ